MTSAPSMVTRTMTALRCWLAITSATTAVTASAWAGSAGVRLGRLIDVSPFAEVMKDARGRGGPFIRSWWPRRRESLGRGGAEWISGYFVESAFFTICKALLPAASRS